MKLANPSSSCCTIRSHTENFFYGPPSRYNHRQRYPPSLHRRLGLYDLENDLKEINNLYRDPTYAKVSARLKTNLFKLKKAYGDTDEKYPALMKLRETEWDK